VQPNPNLLDIHRVAENMRERSSYVRLDRNERVTPFTPAEFAPMVAAIQPEMFCAYPDPSPLVDRLAASLSIPSDGICLTNGSDAAIRKIFQTFLRDRDTVLLPEPTYAMYPIYARMFGATTSCVSYGRDRTLDVSLFMDGLAASPRIAALACPDQPTGAVLAAGEIRRIAECAQRHDVLLVIDEAYYPFYPVTAVQLTREFKNVVVTRTFSKVGGLAGLRLGYFVADPEVIGYVERVRGAHEVNEVAIQVGCYLTDHPEIGTRFVREIEAGRTVLSRTAAELGFGCPPSPANFQLVELPPPFEPREVTAALKARGYLVKGGFDHPSVERCIRVTLAGPDVIGPFGDALKEVCARA